MSETLAEARAEVETLHDFFTGWFSGALPESDEVFAQGVTDRLHPEFEMVLPSGTVLGHAAILTAIRRASGSAPDFRIEIRDVRVLGDWPHEGSGAGLVLASFVEAQTGARNTTPPDNQRRSTVLFERRGERLLWRHVHETALDAG